MAGVWVANVFLSYAGEDLALARTVHGWLADDGHEVFEYLDPRDGVALGAQWEQQLYERLRWADAMVCVITSAYVASTWCTAEVGIARSQGTRLLPLVAESGVAHPLLTTTHHADYARDPDAARATLAEALRRVEASVPDGRPPFPGLRWPGWAQRVRQLRRRTIAGLIAAAAAVVLGAAGLTMVIDRDTIDAATQRQRDADPCRLLDTAALETFGDVVPTTPQYLQSCRATITSTGHETILRVAFEPTLPVSDVVRSADGRGEWAGGVYIVRGEQLDLDDRDECTYRLWLDEIQPVIAIETRSYDKTPIKLCPVSEAALWPAIIALARNGGISYPGGRTEKFAHDQSDACQLLDSSALSKVPGLDPKSAEPGYANWTCTWSGSDDAEVTLELVLEDPDFTGYDDEVKDVDGKPAYVSGDSEDCDADVVHRGSPGPGQATEMLRLGVKAPRSSPEKLCTLVTDLATAAEQQLPG